MTCETRNAADEGVSEDRRLERSAFGHTCFAIVVFSKFPAPSLCFPWQCKSARTIWKRTLPRGGPAALRLETQSMCWLLHPEPAVGTQADVLEPMK